MRKPAAPARKQTAVRTHPVHPGHGGVGHGVGILGGGRLVPARGGGSKAAPAKKHHKKAARHKHAATSKHRGLALSGLPVCAAEALAATLALSGWPVSDADVLALYECTPGADGTGASILATLEAAASHGLKGCRPAGLEPAWSERDQTLHQGGCNPWENPLCPLRARGGSQWFLILGVDLPGAHTVAVAPDGCWLSWGEHYDPAAFPDAVIEEAWAISWPAEMRGEVMSDAS